MQKRSENLTVLVDECYLYTWPGVKFRRPLAAEVVTFGGSDGAGSSELARGLSATRMAVFIGVYTSKLTIQK
jgi:hypothetical protein